ncbi:MAG: DJ-1/PfpI family protein [Candidatus Thorarchaeota archaeon]|nr:DJ-1/PfpI family protein [Candidatus Thorarchaeota archaeon]
MSLQFSLLSMSQKNGVKQLPNIMELIVLFDMIRTKPFVLVSLVIMLVIFSSSPTLVPCVEAQEIGDIKVLMLIADYFGWNYFDAKELLESWGVNVTTIAHSLDYEVPSCLNREPRGTTADLLLQDVDFGIINEFDALFIPAGGHWSSLIASNRALNFTAYAYSQGLIVAAVCIGNRIISDAFDIVNGSSVVSYLMSNINMRAAGATTRSGYRVVADNRIITGGTGGGVSDGGYIEAPTSEVCKALVREAMEYSQVQDANLVSSSTDSVTNITISAEVSDLDSILGDLASVDTNISEVTAMIYTKQNRTLVDSVQLFDSEQDGTFTGSYETSINGEYVIDIEVEDTNSTLEIEHEALSFVVGPVFIIDPIIFGIVGAGALVVVAVVVVIKKR